MRYSTFVLVDIRIERINFSLHTDHLQKLLSLWTASETNLQPCWALFKLNSKDVLRRFITLTKYEVALVQIRDQGRVGTKDFS